MPLPPEVDDAISPRSPLRPTRKSFAFALRTAASRPVGASEQESVASRCATAAAAFVATHSFNGWRCCPIPPLYKVLLRQRLLAPFYTASKRVTIIGFCPTERCTRIIRLSAERIYRQWNTSANILRFALHGGQRHGSTSSSRSGSEQDIAPSP